MDHDHREAGVREVPKDEIPIDLMSARWRSDLLIVHSDQAKSRALKKA
jgi:hypothetical protein